MTNPEAISTKRVFLIDDHPLMRAGIAKVVEMEHDFEICGELGCGRGALDRILAARPDVILLDLSLPDASGLELIKDFRCADIGAPILVISMHEETLYAERALRAGANGYLRKDEAANRVVEGIRTVLAGEVFLSAAMNKRLLQRVAGVRGVESEEELALHTLSDREFEVFELIGKGMSSHTIGATLSISPKTVDAHRANIKRKLAVADAAELLRRAIRWAETGLRAGA